MERMLLALLRKKPVDWMSFSRSSWGTFAYSAADLYLRKRDLVTRLTRSSVHCAERIVATRSSKGFLKLRLHLAFGYVALRMGRMVRTRSMRCWSFLEGRRAGRVFAFAVATERDPPEETPAGTQAGPPEDGLGRGVIWWRWMRWMRSGRMVLG